MFELLRDATDRRSAFYRQIAVCGAVAALLGVIVVGLYWRDRRREWGLRVEQANHRLDVAFELISRELDRVRSDALFLADGQAARAFAAGDETHRLALEAQYASFVQHKKTYDQIRLLNMSGEETIRVNYTGGNARVIPRAELQDKEDRYYFRESLGLGKNEVFVSDLDLNLEHGVIERPLKPVIRFVAPVVDEAGRNRSLLVLNYLGARLLEELQQLSLPGFTLLLRGDGNYLLSADADDAWGWLLGHGRTFDVQFPAAWDALLHRSDACKLTSRGAFAGRWANVRRHASAASSDARVRQRHGAVMIVSYLPRALVFSESAKLLRRLSLVVVCTLVPLAVLTRYWAHASVGRAVQARRVAQSEERLRELSSRLLRIQEEERRAISRQIHDDLGQQVTAIGLDLKLAERNLPTDAARPHLRRAIRENGQLLETLHAFAKRVRPAVLDDLGLYDAVESHLWDFEQRTGIVLKTKLDFDSEQLPPMIAENAYRLLQESLNNVAKHAAADHVDVRMQVDRSGGDHRLRILVADNGRGCNPDEFDGSRLGIVGMRERVNLLGGQLRISSPADQGTRIEVSLPLPRATPSPVGRA